MNTKKSITQKATLSIFSWWLLISLISVLIVYPIIYISNQLNGITTLLIIPMSIFVHYMPLRIVLPRLIKNGDIAIYKDNFKLSGRGVSIIPLAWGLLWRWLIINAISNLVISGLNDIFSNSDILSLLIVNIAIVLLSSYMALLWLIKIQYGRTKIYFEPNFSSLNETIDHATQSVEIIKDGTKGILSTLAVLSFFGVGFIQLVAIYAYFTDYLSWWVVPSLIGSIIFAYSPIIGSLLGVIAATSVWDWKWYYAVLLFFYPLVLFTIAFGLTGFISLLRGR